MPRILFGLVELVMLILFVLSARFAYRSGGRQRLVELLSAVPFGLLLEQDLRVPGNHLAPSGRRNGDGRFSPSWGCSQVARRDRP